MKRILIHHKRNETSAAIVEDGKLINYYVDRDDNPHLLGNIYKGKIQNFLPGIQAVFVDIGRDIKMPSYNLAGSKSMRSDRI